jgi:phage-related minor tail protein
MDLAELKFVVLTDDLEKAATRIKELGTEVSKLNKPMQDLTKESAKSNKELSKAEEAAAKAALAQLKLEQAQTKSADSTGKSTSVLERQTMILGYMATGLSKGQASYMATAKAAGALDEELGQLETTLKTQRSLIGGDAFDKSIGLMQKLSNETKVTSEVNKLFNQSLGLTEKQMIELAREKERLIALYNHEKRSLDGLDAEYQQIINKSVELNRLNDARTNSMRQQVKAQNDATKANNYISSEMERLNRLTESNGTITSATNNKQIKFEQALKASGKTAKEQADLLKLFNEQMLSTQKAAGNRQVDYLSRALGPQITDIGVGLATGQAPLTILLQQGGQLRDQFALAGVAGADMGKMLVQASKAMVVSVKDIGLAVGQLVTGAITGTGKAIADSIIAPFTRMSEAKAALKQLDDGLISSLRYARLMEVANGRMIQSFISLSKVAGTVAVVGLVMLSKGLSDVIKEQDALATQLVLTGASLGVNTTAAISYANSLNSVGVTTASALKVIQAMAKEGGFLAGEINTIVVAANNLKFAGVAIEDTVKQFAKLKEKPVEALLEIARATGMVAPEITKLVYELTQQGKTSEAAAVAMKAYADVTIQQKDRLKSELSGFAVFIKSLSSNVGEFFDDVFRSLWRKASPTEAIKKEIADVENTIKMGTGASDTTKASNNAKLLALKEQLKLTQQASDADQTRLSDQARSAKAYEGFIKDSEQFASNEMKRKKELAEAETKYQGLVKSGQISQVQYEQLIANIQDKYKTPKTDSQKESDKLFKSYLTDLAKISNLTNGAIKEQENYTKAQKLALDIFASPAFKKYPEQQRIEIANAIERAHAEELIANELERQQKINEQVVKTRNELVEAGAKQLDASKQTTQALIDESALYDYKLTLVGKEEKEAEKLLALKKIQIEYEKEIARIKSLNLLSGTKEDLELEAYKQFILKRENLDKDANLKAALDFQKQFDNLKTGISDSIVTALFEGGKSGSKKLRDVLVAELKKPVTVIVNALVNAALGGSSGGGGSGSSLVGNFISNAASKSLGNITIGGSTLAAAGESFATGFMTTVGGGSVEAASAAYSAAGMQGVSTGLSAGAAVASAIPYVAGALLVANALGLFKTTKQVGSGIEGTLGSGDINSYTTMRKSGSLFSGPKYWRENRGEFSGSDALQATFADLKNSTSMMAEAIGKSSDDIAGYTKKIEISFDGLTNEQIQDKIATTFKDVGNELAALVLGAGATAEQLSSLYNNVMQQRYDLEAQLLELQGDTVALRERERAKIYDTNKALYDQINALKDKQEADAAAAESLQKLTAATTTIVDEINRLRGVNTSSTALESQFAILTAQARSGDLTALAQLPEVTKGLEQIAASSAVNATDIIVARARLAQSLQDTLGYVGANGLLSSSATTSVPTVSSVSATGAPTSVNSSSSNQELLSALVTEVQGLRAEVRADVSHNAKTAKILERANQDGETLSVSATIDGGVV